MKPRSRSLLILSATLLVGMLLGALVHARFFDKRVKRMHRLSTPDGFVESYIHTIEPTNPPTKTRNRNFKTTFGLDATPGSLEL